MATAEITKPRRNGKHPPIDQVHSTATPGGLAKLMASGATNGAVDNRDMRIPRPTISSEAIDIELTLLDRHPLNRRPSPASIAERAASLKTHGQAEPIIARILDDGRYQVLSGETRWLAAKAIKWPTIQARTVRCDDARAFEILVLANAQRTELNPIEKAEQLRYLVQPVAEGGLGKDRDEAAKLCGFEAAPAANNVMRLLELPAAWQKRVASGEVPQTFARVLVPYAHAPRLMEAIEHAYTQDLKNPHMRDRWETRERFEGSAEQAFDEFTRPVEPKVKRRYSQGDFPDCPQPWNYTGDWAILFKLTPDLEKRLDIHDFKIGKETLRLATNVAEYDRLQIPAIKAKVAEKLKKGMVAKAEDDDERPLTAAEKKAQEKAKAATLEKRTNRWRHQWLSSLCVAALRDVKRNAGWQAAKAALWIAGARHRPEVRAGDKLQSLLVSTADEYQDEKDLWAGLAGVNQDEAAAQGIHRQLVAAALETADRNPDYPVWPTWWLESLAGDLGIDLAAAWAELAEGAYRGHAAPFELLETLYKAHSAEQLDALCHELGIAAVDQSRKCDKIEWLIGAEAIPMPKCIAPLPTASPPVKTRKGKKAK